MSRHEHGQSQKRKDETEPVETNVNALHMDDLQAEIEQALEGLQFGEIKIIVRDSRIVQIEKTTRNRPAATKKPSS